MPVGIAKDVAVKRIISSLLLGLCLITAKEVFAAFEFRGTEARLLALGNLHDNPAQSFLRKTYELESSYSRLFALSELQDGKLVLGLPGTRWGQLQFATEYFGTGTYQECCYEFQHSVVLGQRMFVGYRVKDMALSISQYGHDQLLGVDCGLQVQIAPKLNIGVLVFNLNNPLLAGISQDIPAGMVTALSSDILHNLKLFLEIDKTTRRKLSVHSGWEYGAWRNFFLRAGVQSYPLRFGLGIGLSYRNTILDYGYFSHAELPGQHYLTLRFDFGSLHE